MNQYPPQSPPPRKQDWMEVSGLLQSALFGSRQPVWLPVQVQNPLYEHLQAFPGVAGLLIEHPPL